ncbi:DUF3732 domain-containing protein [Succinivibrio dextrinosolvens]|uniref:DUF3732 domain-containing protein n=1 Tax=Succinivibrio dextrinosolvens TaxID=83771 RepID=UPI0019215C2B|nr:DUF3732 domain-containing protein [Succinivibrio dextrinosolvens]
MMQIRELVIYSKSGHKRTISFSIGKVNIITGKSKSGKSAVGDIIEYCLGGNSCHIAEGIVRDNALWYGLLLQFDTNKVFVARKNPDEGRQSSSACYYIVGSDITSPNSVDFDSNTNVDGIEELLNRQLGISENEHIPNKGESRNSLEANIRHSLFYCFQGQNEIASRLTLFHRQAENGFIPQIIKDSLPYFLGAVNEDSISLSSKKRSKERQLKLLQRDLYEKQSLSGTGSERAVSLIEEAISVGLLSEDTFINRSDYNSLYTTLKGISLSLDNEPECLNRLSNLQIQLESKREELRKIEYSIREANNYFLASNGYSAEKEHQKVRLSSIGLFENLSFESGKCPLCSGVLKLEPPSIAMMKESIKDLDKSLSRVEKERPKLKRFIEKQMYEADSIKNDILNLKFAIEAEYNQIDELQRIRDLNTCKAKVFGRISYWLENVKTEADSNELNRKIKELEESISEINLLISNDSIKDRIVSALSVIQNYMTKWASQLDTEYSDCPYRLDLSKVTVFLDTNNKSISLRDMGSASNWLVSHLVTMFGLHKFFVENNRPVPNFLFLDQPSQVYFPEGFDKKDGDIKSVEAIYSFIRQRVNELSGKLQVIVVDHAKLESDDFNSDIVEDWHSPENKLIPIDWIEK